jgi:hypothetical protein
MDASLFDDWLRENFFAFVAVIVSGATFSVALLQWKLAEQKLRLDLYNRRYEIYMAIYAFYTALIGWKGSDEDKAARDRFFKAKNEAQFLFSPESGVEALYDELHKKSLKVTSFKENPEMYRSDSKLMMTSFEESNRILLKDFDEGLTRLKKAVAPYMSFHKI